MIDIEDLMSILSGAERVADSIRRAVDRAGPGGRRITRQEAGEVVEASLALLGRLVALAVPWR
jgi:hypothetical protein